MLSKLTKSVFLVLLRNLEENSDQGVDPKVRNQELEQAIVGRKNMLL